MSVREGLTPEQIKQLSEIFRSEAIEHVKGIAEVLFSIEDGKTDVGENIARAFRDAHSLKGSAGTLGFGRIAIMAHRFEDALGAVKNQQRALDAPGLDALLGALESIRLAVSNSQPGDDDLTSGEQAVVELLTRTFGLAEKRPSLNPPPPPGAIGSVKTEQRSPSPGRSNEPEGTKQELIRVSEQRIDQVINQFGELFEASLQLESIGHDLSTNIHESNRLTDGLSVHLKKLEGTPLEAEAMELLDMARNLAILSRTAHKKFGAEERQLNKLIQRSQEALREIRIAPISNLHLNIRNQVREIARSTGKKVSVEFSGGEYAVDRAILDAIEKPLIHLLRNAVDHGIETPSERRTVGKPETGHLSISARHLGDAVELTIEDDGSGIDPERIREKLKSTHGMTDTQVAELSSGQLFDFLFESGFTTTRQVSQISGRGVGLDVVKHTIEQFGGEVSIQSEQGRGTRISLRLPLTMSSIRCLLFGVGLKSMAIPAANVEKVLVLLDGDVRSVGGGDVISYGDGQLPLTTFENVLAISDSGNSDKTVAAKFAAIVRFGDRRFAFGFDQIHEYTQLVIKPLGDLLERVPNVSGLALLGTGQLALVLNPADLIRTASGGGGEKSRAAKPAPNARQRTILVTDDSIAIRTMQKALLESCGFKVLTASDGLQALQVLAYNDIDLVLSDVQMPNMDGFELTKAIKSREKTRNIPVILITSLGSDADIQAGLQAGADGHIVKKDLTRNELMKTINQLL